MAVSRATVVSVVVALLLFVLTFVVINHSPSSDSARSRHALRRGVKMSSVSSATSTENRHVDRPAVRPATSGVSANGARNPTDAVKPPRRSPSSTAVHGFAIPPTTAASDAETVAKKRKSKSAADVDKGQTHSVSNRMYFRLLNQSRKLNETWRFRRQLKRSERVALLKMFGVVAGALRASNVTFWINGGTLLGSYRHHNLIPWDDDVDVVLRRSQMGYARRAIRSLAPAYRLYVEKDATSSAVLAWRVFARNGSVPVTRKHFRFPTINLLFYTRNATHVWLEPHNIWGYLVWRRSTVFPLHLRPFDTHWVPAPCNTRSYLITEYNDPQVIYKCVSPRIMHRKDIAQRRTTVPCRTLRWLPLVRRQRQRDRHGGSVVESLMRGNVSLRQHTIRQKC